MSVTRLRIQPDGNVTGLWDDQIDWSSLGNLTVRRASYVEFCDRKQMWYVRLARPRTVIHRIAQLLSRRPFGEVLYWSPTRKQALAWEREHFSTGTP